ncbi:zinc finger protein ZAT1 [Rhodamnia argentea]|uniref:Zinc finger protein ZAT1 n=1 Tax=Rhodamnia argentea TaxID=178133 RepID=A0A8B8PEB6_9MYRT|nr:zinc finger protein ZAT1 [Rhodamnia argentea]
MEKNRVCTICNRRFANGKAMGGHMRSHFAKLPLPSKQPHVQSEPTPLPALSSSPLHRDRNNVTSKDFRLSLKIYHPLDRSAKSESSFIASTDPALHDKGSEAESQRNLKGRRSSRRCKPPRAETSEQVSSVSENFSADEDVALCLLMLLRDSWTRKGKGVGREVVDESAEDDEKDNEDDGDGDGDGDESFRATRANHRHHPKYRCETCNKVFRSYQAYGGHKASQSHKRMKVLDGGEKEGGNGGAKTKTLTDQRLFKCPFCDKVFDSGQGLGGHKKVHFFNSAGSKSSNNNRNNNVAMTKVGECRIDLNLLPSPEEEEGSHEPPESSDVSSQ